MALRVFEFTVNPDDLELGMKAISLVDKPAIESEYIAFNQQEKPVIFKFKDEKKYIVAGLALIPDKLIYRVDEASGEEYFGYFSAETIEIIMDKFMKESANGTLSNVNFQHDSEDKAQAHLVESFILRSEEMVNAIKAMGIEDAVLGAWFVSYKFDNQADYNKAIETGFTGFSVEIMLQRELKFKNNINNNNEKFMTKVKSFIDKFKAMLQEFESGEVKLEEGSIADSDIVLRWGEVGQPVMKVVIAEDGTDSTEVMPEGEYVLESGDVLVVDAMGNLLELKPNAEAPAPLPEEEMAEEEKPEEEKPAEVPEEEKPAEVPEEEAPKDVTSKTLGEIVDVSKDGEYVIKVVVSGGAVTEASVEAAQDLIKKADFEKLQAQNVELQERIDSIKVKPLFTEFNKVIEKSDFVAKNNLEATLHKLGLNK